MELFEFYIYSYVYFDNMRLSRNLFICIGCKRFLVAKGEKIPFLTHC